MAETHVVSALIEKRAEIAGIIVSLEKQIREYQRELLHLDATLKMFDPDIKLSEIRPKRPAYGRSGYFAQGELSDRCHDALRRADGKPVSAEEIAIQAMRDKLLDPGDNKIRSDFIRRLLWTLERLQRNGQIERVGRGIGVRWQLPQ